MISHFKKLEHMYLSVPFNDHFDPEISIKEGEAEITYQIKPDYFHAAFAVHMVINKNCFLLLLFYFSLALSGCFLLKKPAAKQPFGTVSIPGGAFMMGDVFNQTDTDATPIHKSIVAPFELARYEITYAAYDSFATAVSRPLPEDDGFGRGGRAVANVTWEEALAFCQHYDFRLPTEVEWEYAARGAGQHQRFAGTDSLEAVNRFVRHEDNSAFYSFQVGTKAPNSLGLYDMSGNVYEWIGHYYEFYPDDGEKPVYKDFEGSAMRIIRGGSFKSPPAHAQTFWRAGTLSDIPSNMIGFRCAKSLIN